MILEVLVPVSGHSKSRRELKPPFCMWFYKGGAGLIIRDSQSAAGIHQAPPTGSALECQGKAGRKHKYKRHNSSQTEYKCAFFYLLYFIYISKPVPLHTPVQSVAVYTQHAVICQ